MPPVSGRDVADLDHHGGGGGGAWTGGRRGRCFLAAAHQGNGGDDGQGQHFDGKFHRVDSI